VRVTTSFQFIRRWLLAKNLAVGVDGSNCLATGIKMSCLNWIYVDSGYLIRLYANGIMAYKINSFAMMGMSRSYYHMEFN
jgi:hypothetical protein